jgi:hypothetical protein
LLLKKAKPHDVVVVGRWRRLKLLDQIGELLRCDGGLLFPVVELDELVEVLVPIVLARLGAGDLLSHLRRHEIPEHVHCVHEGFSDFDQVILVDLDSEVGLGVAIRQYLEVLAGQTPAFAAPAEGATFQMHERVVANLLDQLLGRELNLDHLTGGKIDEIGRGQRCLHLGSQLGSHGGRGLCDSGHYGVSLGRCFRLDRTVGIY